MVGANKTYSKHPEFYGGSVTFLVRLMVLSFGLPSHQKFRLKICCLKYLENHSKQNQQSSGICFSSRKVKLWRD